MLARRTPLKRKTPMRRFSTTSKYARRERDKDFLAFIHWCPCALKNGDPTGECEGRIEADHAGKKTTAFRKTDDTTCIPLCTRHHRARTTPKGFTGYRGFFKDWSKDKMRAWADEKIKFYRNLYKNLVAMGQTPWRRKRA